MSRDIEMKTLLEQTRFCISHRLQNLLLCFVVIGIIGFVAGLAATGPTWPGRRCLSIPCFSAASLSAAWLFP